MDKQKVLKDSIARLLQLNISDREIIENLSSVGIDKEAAADLLQQTRDELSGKKPIFPSVAQAPIKEEKAQKKEPQKPSSKKPEPPTKQVPPEVEIPDDEDIYSKVEDDEEDGLYTPVKEKPIINPSYGSEKTSYSRQSISLPPEKSDEAISSMWEKGILSTIDAKLGEMKRIKEDLDTYLDRKIDERIAKETKKFETVLDSQRVLYNSKIDSHLDQKADEIKKVIESNMRHMEDLHGRVQDDIAKSQGEKKFNLELINGINEKLTGLDLVKSQMISETNSSLINMESKFSEFMAESEKKRDEIESRVNSALQLESKITEGLGEELRGKIEDMRIEKEKEFESKISAKIAELDKLTDQVDPETIIEKLKQLNELSAKLERKPKELDSHIEKSLGDVDKSVSKTFDEFRKEFSAYKKEISRLHSDNLDELRKQYAASVDELFTENLVEWDKKLKEKKKEIDDLKGQLDVEKFNASMGSLDEFKQQFINTIKKSVDDYNKSKKELSESMISREKAINSYLDKIDAKIAELSLMQKKLAEGFSKSSGKSQK